MMLAPPHSPPAIDWACTGNVRPEDPPAKGWADVCVRPKNGPPARGWADAREGAARPNEGAQVVTDPPHGPPAEGWASGKLKVEARPRGGATVETEGPHDPPAWGWACDDIEKILTNLTRSHEGREDRDWQTGKGVSTADSSRKKSRKGH